jgi:hypothetical protein
MAEIKKESSADAARSDTNFDRGQKRTRPEKAEQPDRSREAEVRENVEDARNDPPEGDEPS